MTNQTVIIGPNEYEARKVTVGLTSEGTPKHLLILLEIEDKKEDENIGTAEIITSFRNLRDGPNGKIQGTALNGSKWDMVEQIGEWYRITPQKSLWIHKSGIKIT